VGLRRHGARCRHSAFPEPVRRRSVSGHCVGAGFVRQGSRRTSDRNRCARSRTFKFTSMFPSAQPLGVARLLRALGDHQRANVRGRPADVHNGVRDVVNSARNPRWF
jgi:hypothetical protein